MLTFKISWPEGLFPTQFRIYIELAWFAVQLTKAHEGRLSFTVTSTTIWLLEEPKAKLTLCKSNEL